MLISTIQSVLSIIIMIVIGYALAYKKWFTEESSNLIVKLVTQISLPALMIYTLMVNFSKQQLVSSALYLILPFASIAIAFLAAIFCAKVIKVKKSRKGLFISLFFNSNTIFMGLPINEALFGLKSVPYVLLYYIANTTFFWTLGIYEISKDGDGANRKLFSIETVKKIVSPPLLGYIVGVILILLGVKLPLWAMDTCRYLGNITTPLSMLFIGATIYSIDLRKVKIGIDSIAVMFGRFLVCPLIIVILCSFIPIPRLMEEVFIIQAGMPVMTNSAIVSKAYNADYEFSAIMISITTMASVAVIPVYMGMMNFLVQFGK